MVQFVIAMGATAIYAAIVVIEVGGFGEMTRKLEILYGERSAAETLSFFPAQLDSGVMLVLGVLAVQWFAQTNSDGTGYLAQRVMACRSDRDARNAAIVFTFLQVVLRSLLWLPIAVGLLILYPESDLPALGTASESFRMQREATFAWGIRDYLPIGIRGLMLTGLLAALASTIDTHLNWGASYWANDIYKRFLAPVLLKREASNKELVWVARLSNVGLLFIALFIMARLSSIQGAWHISLLFGCGLGVVLMLRWLWWRINIWSEYAAVISSILLAPILLTACPEMEEGGRLLIMTLATTTVVLLVTFLTKPESESCLRRFYEKAKPIGLWGLVCEDTHESELKQKSLSRAIMLTTVYSFVVFAILCIIGSVIL